MIDLLTAVDRIVSACEPANSILALRKRVDRTVILPSKEELQSVLNSILMHGESIKQLAQSGLDVLEPEKAAARDKSLADTLRVIKELSERKLER